MAAKKKVVKKVKRDEWYETPAQKKAREAENDRLVKESKARRAAEKKAMDTPEGRKQERLKNLENFVRNCKYRLERYKKKDEYYSAEDLESDMRDYKLL